MLVGLERFGEGESGSMIKSLNDNNTIEFWKLLWGEMQR